MALHLCKQFQGIQIPNPFKYVSRKISTKLKKSFYLLETIYLIHLGMRHPVIWPLKNIVILFYNLFHIHMSSYIFEIDINS